jgi:hypothetical protein
MKGTDELAGALSYAGVIAAGPVVPLVVYLSVRHGSPGRSRPGPALGLSGELPAACS